MADKEAKPDKAQKAEKHKADNKKKGGKPSGPVIARLETGTIEKNPEAPRLKKFYFDTVIPQILKDLGRSNQFQVPRLMKIVVNMGVSEAKENIQHLDSAREELAAITGQRPQVRRAKKSISNFKLREGMPIGLRVTLRGDRMYEFLDRLITTAVPRIRDFRGLDSRGFDGRGNYNLGLREHHIFPEVNLEKSPKARGMNITFVTTATDDAEGVELLGRLGMPFKKAKKAGEPAAA